MRLPLKTLLSLTVAITAVVGTPAAAAPFDGAWSLDSKASQPMDPILDALGYGWVSRKIFATLDVEQYIAVKSGAFAVRVKTLFTNDTVVLPTNKRWAVGKNLDGGTTQRRSYWRRPGTHLVTEDRFESGHLMITERVLVSPDRFEERLQLKQARKPTLRGVRVFRRR